MKHFYFGASGGPIGTDGFAPGFGLSFGPSDLLFESLLFELDFFESSGLVLVLLLSGLSFLALPVSSLGSPDALEFGNGKLGGSMRLASRAPARR